MISEIKKEILIRVIIKAYSKIGMETFNIIGILHIYLIIEEIIIGHIIKSVMNR